MNLTTRVLIFYLVNQNDDYEILYKELLNEISNFKSNL